MYAFVVKRLLFAIVTLLAVLTLVFVIVRVVPGDPAQVILGDQASREAIEMLRERLGLNKPMITQYWQFVSGALRGDWGQSMTTGTPVFREVANVLPYTIELTLSSLALASLFGIPLGIWAAVRRNQKVDYLIRIFSLLGLSYPVFVVAIFMLFIFAIALPWFPVISAAGNGLSDRLRGLTLPAVCLAFVMMGFITRVARSAMLEVLGEDYVRTAMAKGVTPGVILWRHCLRNALIPIVTVIGLNVGIQIGNSVLTEIVFNRPGLGKLIVGALNQRDYTMLQGLMVVYTFIIVVVNLFTDLTYGFIDPRVKYN
ncbi:MAG: ABC transporter permease [Thermodesulfobacteriota bacterium]